MNIFDKNWNKTSTETKFAFLLKMFYTKGKRGFIDYIENNVGIDNYDYHQFDMEEGLKYFEKSEEAIKADLNEAFSKALTLKNSLNKHNCDILIEKGEYSLLLHFTSNFRGDIVEIHKIGEYKVVETLKDGKSRFYGAKHMRWVYHSLDHALLAEMFNCDYLPALFTILEKSNGYD